MAFRYICCARAERPHKWDPAGAELRSAEAARSFEVVFFIVVSAASAGLVLPQSPDSPVRKRRPVAYPRAGGRGVFGMAIGKWGG